MTDTSSPACVPGQSVPCTCTGADAGVQVCRPDGSGYDPCACGPANETTTTEGTTGTGDTEGTTGTGGTESTDGTTASSCGDGVTDPGEDCDDMGESATCNADCSSSTCGDGIVNTTAGEDCDDMGESATCNADCSSSMCGDGLVNATAGEACDDGGESTACDVDCTPAGCGDGTFNATAGELCDTGGPTAMCDGDCSPVSCGDGSVNAAAGEACDDDGESATCNVDCSLAACGDGITNASAGEACDDAGASLGCDDDCSPASCGDGLVNAAAGEDCDDAGESAACDADCTLAMCGDAHLNAAAGELCDGDALAGATCVTEGFDAGALACAPGCAAYDPSSCAFLPDPPVLGLAFSPIKRFEFSWAAVADADHYQLEESRAPGEPFVQLGGDIVGTSVAHEVPLHLRWQASYRLRACNLDGCSVSAAVSVTSSLAEAVGYFKASNPDGMDQFGVGVALSGDGNTLAVSAIHEASSATGIDGDQTSNAATSAGAVYVFVRDGMGGWSQQAYVKASNTGVEDRFGSSVALSDDGSTLAVGAHGESSNASGIDGDQANDDASASGAVYLFERDGLGTWSQQAYIKASNPGAVDIFGINVALSAEGDTLAVGARSEDSNATGIDGDQTNDDAPSSGAVYVFVRDGLGTWSQQAYVKASNTAENDSFGGEFALSADGDTLAVGAWGEDGAATGIDGDQASDAAVDAGAVYVFVRDGLGTWSQQAYVKASNTDPYDAFGIAVALSADGDTLAVGAHREDSAAVGIDGNQASNVGTEAGAVYVFVRDGLGTWSQQAYVKASNPSTLDRFGTSVALSADGSILAVATPWEDGNSTGLDGDGANNVAADAGAAYVFVRDGMGAWSQAAYVKASNAAANDFFGIGTALSGDGSTLAVSALLEGSASPGVGGDQASNALFGAGAVYLF